MKVMVLVLKKQVKTEIYKIQKYKISLLIEMKKKVVSASGNGVDTLPVITGGGIDGSTCVVDNGGSGKTAPVGSPATKNPGKQKSNL